MSAQRPAPGERWVFCELGHVHWGANGGAGLLIRHRPDDSEPSYLLTLRSRLVDEGGSWGVPGGAIRDGEPAEKAARRETLEEIGYLPPYRPDRVDIQDCGGGWRFWLITVDVEERFDAYSVQETDATGWFTRRAMRRLPLHPGIGRWLEHFAPCE
ncbi:MAG TPA: NUDIX hydrolase [Solirubrobacteraceae bacterium]|nr:NUDIX hydrolase [Solirubrobacteraceae bacterium]